MTLMSIRDILLGSGSAVVLILTIIQVTPIKFNPWSFLAKKIGHALNGELIEKVDKLEKNVANLREESDEREATNCRSRILRFGDEILHDHGLPHSKEHYNQILLDISAYENFCDNHPRYMNNVAVETIKHIKRRYREHLEDDSFL